MIRRSLIFNVHKLFNNSCLYDSSKIEVLYSVLKLKPYHSTVNRKYHQFVRFCSNKNASSHTILYDVLKLRDKNTSNSIIDVSILRICIFQSKTSIIILE